MYVQYILKYSIMLSSLSLTLYRLSEVEKRENDKEKSFNKTIYSIGSMTRCDFASPPPALLRLFVCSFYEATQQYKGSRKVGEIEGERRRKMQSCKEKRNTEIYLVLWLVRGVTTATKVHVVVGVEWAVRTLRNPILSCCFYR